MPGKIFVRLQNYNIFIFSYNILDFKINIKSYQIQKIKYKKLMRYFIIIQPNYFVIQCLCQKYGSIPTIHLNLCDLTNSFGIREELSGVIIKYNVCLMRVKR